MPSFLSLLSPCYNKSQIILCIRGSQNGEPQAAVSASPENFLEIQILRLEPHAYRFRNSQGRASNLW